MPIYEYVCPDCRHEFETLVLSSREDVACARCGSRKVEKRFSVFGVGQASSGAAECGEMPACSPTGCARPDCRMN